MVPMAVPAVRAMTPTSAADTSLMRSANNRGHASSGNSARCGRGFTLMELVIVLAILALGSLLVLPNITGMSARTFSAQVREANALLNYARRTAVVTGQPATATFQTAAADQSPEQSTARESARSRLGVDDVWSGPGIEVGYRDSTGQQVVVTDVIEITFFPEGGSTGGELTFSQNNRQAVITVDPFSGKVRTGSPDD